ncbi:MAG: polyphosphate polymerase domain-containing protein [Clostridia bacterium]|nr:polyphosphate polymerase domain-containing protein [Clostridia bacterium]
MLEVLRKEVKYSLSTVSFYKARPLLEACMQLDPHCKGGQGYPIRSLYFDSAWDGDLTDVLSGLLSKQKVRLRCYSPETETLKLEYKCKTGTDSRKLSLPVSRADARRMIGGRYAFLTALQDPVATELYGRLKAGAYQPRVVVAYKRIAYIAPQNDVRVTFDYDVGASFDPAALLDTNAVFEPVSPTASGVLEVKYNHFLPAYIETALQGLNLSPTANSKYAQSRLLL